MWRPLPTGPFITYGPLLPLRRNRTAADRLVKTAAEEWGIPEKEVRTRDLVSWQEQFAAKEDIRAAGRKALAEMEANHGRGIVLSGRPYHIDPEINHGIPELIASYGLTVFTEDSLPVTDHEERPLRVVDQWVYHSGCIPPRNSFPNGMIWSWCS